MSRHSSEFGPLFSRQEASCRCGPSSFQSSCCCLVVAIVVVVVLFV